MNKFLPILIVLLGCSSLQAQAQRRGSYTLLQAGGIYGLATTADHDPRHGYQFQFMFGRNFYDRLYLGLGIGNEVYRGRTTLANGNRSTHRVNTLPIFADFRAPIAQLSPLGRLGTMVNAGYAPSIGSDYFRGFMGKAGLTYGHLLVDGSSLLISAGYGFQQFGSRFFSDRHVQHNLFVTVGLFVH
ncbi:hypothetical protein SAMN05421747_11417 [Parapedobacter composti]|uniref:Outer membrane protein beta-barrel domain-containing protein n=1 Tax=Parapedobacter composti TaxID=623281 RepID=A0A1I1K116_9SPHI|nr:hypothetical protein [Parapedobacter composti]SFC54191.1 hypothetical protein SAMN05421747_11417 [Parapedobacter composti]